MIIEYYVLAAIRADHITLPGHSPDCSLSDNLYADDAKHKQYAEYDKDL